MRPKHGVATWAGLVALGAGLEAVALRSHRHEHTLSHALRQSFFTHTPAGRMAFTGGWVALSCWLVPHILDPTSKDIL